MEPIGLATSVVGFGLSIKSYKDANEARRDDGHVLFAEMQARYDELCIQLSKEERQLSAAAAFKFSEATTALAISARQAAVRCLASGKVPHKYLRLGAWVVNYHCIKVIYLGDDGLTFADALVAWAEALAREKHVQHQLQYIKYSNTHHLLCDQAEAIFNAPFGAAKLGTKHALRSEGTNARKCRAVEDAVDAVRESISILSKLFDAGKIGREAAESVGKFADRLAEVQFGRSTDLSQLHEKLLGADERPPLPGCLHTLISYLDSTKYPEDSENMRKEWRWFFDDEQDFKDAKGFVHDKYFMKLELSCVTDGGVQIENYAQLFEDKAGNAARKILIYGDAGAGKTTYVHKLANDWCQGRKTNANASESARKLRERFPIALLFRMNQHRGDKKLVDMLSQLDVSLAERDAIEKALLDSNVQSKTLIIFDGADEWLGGNANDDNDILRMMAGDLLRGATVIVTSRPLSREERRRAFSEHRGVRVCGLSDEEIDRNSSALHPDMLAHLRNDPSLKELVKNPLLFFMAANVLKSNLVTLLNTEYKDGIEVFDIIEIFLKYAARRRNTEYGKKLGPVWLALGRKFLQKHWSHIPGINELTKTQETDKEALSNGHQIGYISIKSETSPHRLIDDFFMAYFLINDLQSRSETCAAKEEIAEMYERVCAELYTEPVGMAVIYFCSAIDSTNQFANASLRLADKTRCLQGNELWGRFVRPLPWLYNAQKVRLPTSVASLWLGLDNGVRFRGSNRSSDTILIQKILEAIPEPMRVNKLYLDDINLPVTGESSLSKTLTRFQMLRKLFLADCRLVSNAEGREDAATTWIAAIAAGLTHASLNRLSYENPQSGVSIVNDLSRLKKVDFIDLEGMSDAIAAWLPLAVQQNGDRLEHLRELQLRHVSLADEDFNLLFQWLQQRPALAALHLNDMDLSEKFALDLFRFANQQRLATLHLGACSMTAPILAAFCEGMLGNKTLKLLTIATDSRCSDVVCGSRIFWQTVVQMNLDYLTVNLDAIEMQHDAEILQAVEQLQSDRRLMDSGVQQFAYRENRQRKAIRKVLSLLAADATCDLPEMSADWRLVFRCQENMDMHEFTLENRANDGGVVGYYELILKVFASKIHKSDAAIRAVIEGDAAVGKTALMQRIQWSMSVKIDVLWHEILLRTYIATVHLKPDDIIEFGNISRAVHHFIFDGVNRVRTVRRLPRIRFEAFAFHLSEDDVAILLEDCLILLDGLFDPSCKTEMPQEVYEEICGRLRTTILITARTGYCAELVRKLRNTEGVSLEDDLKLLGIPAFKLVNLATAAVNTDTHFDHSLLLLQHNHHPFIHSAVTELMAINSTARHHKWELFDVISLFITKLVDHAIQTGKVSPLSKEKTDDLLCQLGGWELQKKYADHPLIEEFDFTNISDEDVRLALLIGLLNPAAASTASESVEMVSAWVASFCSATWMTRRGSHPDLNAIHDKDRYFYSAMNEADGQGIFEWSCSKSQTNRRKIPWLYNVDRLTIPVELSNCWIDDACVEFASKWRLMDSNFIDKVLTAADTRIHEVEAALFRQILFTGVPDSKNHDFQSIEALRLNFCAFSPRASKQFSLLIRGICRKICTLVVFGCDYWIYEPSEWFANFHNFDSLVELNLARTPLSTDGFVAKLASSLKSDSDSPRFQQLKYLILSDCGIKADKDLFEWLSHCQQLNVLSLQGLNVGESSGAELCKVLFHELKYLQVLNMLDCSLPDSFIDGFIQIDPAALCLTRFLFGKAYSDRTNCRTDFWTKLYSSETIRFLCVRGLEKTLHVDQVWKMDIALINIDAVMADEPQRHFDKLFCDGALCGMAPILDAVYFCDNCHFSYCELCNYKLASSHPHTLIRATSPDDPILKAHGGE